jgi:uncharacterized protein (DUF2236 family)
VTADQRPSSKSMPAEGAPLGPGSLLWTIAGDPRSLLPGTGAGIMQLMLPGLGAGVSEHSNFFDDPFDRIFRSIPVIWGSVFADDEPDGSEKGRFIRDLHTDIKGVDHHGERYHALDPDVFWWAHATFTWEMFRAREHYIGGSLSRAEEEQLYAESVTWYRRYGVSDRPVPADLDAFRARFDEICRTELEVTPAVEWLSDPDKNPTAKPREVSLPGVASALNGVATKTSSELTRTMVYGVMPAVVRELLDVSWTTKDRALYAGICGLWKSLGPAIRRGAMAQMWPEGTPHLRAGTHDEVVVAPKQ